VWIHFRQPAGRIAYALKQLFYKINIPFRAGCAAATTLKKILLGNLVRYNRPSEIPFKHLFHFAAAKLDGEKKVYLMKFKIPSLCTVQAGFFPAASLKSF